MIVQMMSNNNSTMETLNQDNCSSSKTLLISGNTTVMDTKQNVPLSVSPVNPNLNREVQNHMKMTGFCMLLLITEVSKQITSYGMKYFNGGVYPFRQTLIVALAELLKFLVFLFVTAMSDSGLKQIKLSLWYAIPSVIFVVNNNIFYLALHYTTPPLWNILIQLRVILTALTYKLFFRRPVTAIQWLALTLLVTGIALSNWIDITSVEKLHTDLVFALGLAVFGSVTSVIGSLVMEFLFKNDGRQFVDKQTQLYLFSSVCAWSVYMVEAFVFTSTQSSDVTSHLSAVVRALFVLDLVLACLGGFMVAVVVKKFDNIVKLYTQALANMFTAIVCSFLFPEFFKFTVTFCVCLILVFVAIIVYELKTKEALLKTTDAVLNVACKFSSRASS